MSGATGKLEAWLRQLALLAAVVGLGAATLWWSRSAPTGISPIPLATQPADVPNRKLRFISCDAARRRLRNDPVLAALRGLSPDFLLMQNVEATDLAAIAAALRMTPIFRPADPDASWGFAIFSNRPLTDVTPLPDASGRDGFWAACSIDQRKMLVGTVSVKSHGDVIDEGKALAAAWRSAGSTPLALGGIFAGPLADEGPVEPTTGWFDALSAFVRIGPGPAVGRIFLSPGWSCTGGGALRGFDVTPYWIEAASASTATATTAPASDD
jgi:hypothetical protein